MSEPVIIKFLHPGIEHGEKPKRSGQCPWNTGDHARKFLRSPGIVIGESGRTRRTDLTFWGEWEPPSSVKKTGSSGQGLPRYLHTPELPQRTPRVASGGRQNTDPYVFGRSHKYIVCQQPSSPRLRALAPGSVILFGSRKDMKFVLDTVFVVKDWESWSGSSGLRRLQRSSDERITETYKRVSIAPMINPSDLNRSRDHSCVEGGGSDSDDTDLRLYFGAMHRDRKDFNGCFSYVPCVPGEAELFARPTIELPGISHGQTQKFQVLGTGFETVADYWKRVVAQVKQAGLSMAIEIDEL